ncbi:hypothetical protein [uncultured Lacinutrix sp.]|uniref:hypothetical protein n=1 Tax=uncultured Lacinutrix sp. TaxID=574032 RepID=UPI00260EC2AB|nr:hypothetical protein [uncultured Lacinutrix sp.]
MKILTRITLVMCLFFVLASCRDTKKEEVETKAAVEQIESIEAETEDIIESVEENAQELKKELNELDNI